MDRAAMGQAVPDPAARAVEGAKKRLKLADKNVQYSTCSLLNNV
jgi:hypothetical protein